MEKIFCKPIPKERYAKELHTFLERKVCQRTFYPKLLYAMEKIF